MSLDPRLHAYRPDLADQRLQGQVECGRYVAGELQQVVAPVVGVHSEPRNNATMISQALLGEQILVFETREGWAWGQCQTDGYVGYLAASALSDQLTEATHRVCVLSSYLYEQPDIKAHPAIPVYLNSLIAVTAISSGFAELAGGRFVWSGHICPIDQFDDDPAAAAERFEHVPYLWGGKTQAGVDCSGLVQMSFAAAGKPCPRDSDMMENGIGQPLLINDLDGLQRGDLVFWKGHVGMMLDAARMVHANGYHMTTVIEPLADAVKRIGELFGSVTGIRRP